MVLFPPKTAYGNGLSEARVQVTEPALLSIVRIHREAGVRALRRAIGGVVRSKVVEWAAHVDARELSYHHHQRHHLFLRYRLHLL